MPVNATGTFGVIETNPFGRFLPLSGGTLTGALVFPVGAAGTPSITFIGDLTTGIFQRTSSTIGIALGGNQRFEFANASLRAGSAVLLGWSSGTSPTGAADTGFSRISAAVVAVGNGNVGNTGGTLRAASLAAGGSDFTITAVNSVSPTSPNRTVTISYGGTTYYLAAKTTND